MGNNPQANQGTILAALRSWGLNPAQQAGVMGNLDVEDPSLDPAAVNPREGAIGIAQWEGGRRTALQADARAHGTTETDLNEQLRFMKLELDGSESGAWRALMAAQTPKDAATAWSQKYERNNPSSLAQRVATAEGLAKSLGATEDPAGSYDPGSMPASGPLAAFSGWQQDLTSIALKIAAAGLAGTLLIVGAYQTFHDKGATS